MKKGLPILIIIVLMSMVLLTGCGVNIDVNFMVDGAVYATINTDGKEALSMPANPIKQGYEFDGWFWDDGTWQRPFTANSLLNTPLEESLSVYAKWVEESDYKGTQAGFNTLTKISDTEYAVEVANAVETLTFTNIVEIDPRSSWTISTDVAGNSVLTSKVAQLAEGDNKLYVLVKAQDNTTKQYTITIRRKPMYTVTFDTVGGSAVASQTVEEDSLATAPTTTKNGYTFAGWNYDFTTKITANTNIIASWDIVPYDITYNLNGGTNHASNPSSYDIEDETITLQSPSKIGYTFAGWSNGGSITSGSTGNKVYTANWNSIAYNITYNLNGGTNHASNPSSYDIEDETITLQSPSKIGYTFAGWDNGGSISSGSTGNKIFTANWNQRTFVITIDANGGPGKYDDIIVNSSESIGKRPSYYIKEGYRLKGFSKDKSADNIIVFPYTPTEDIKLYAIWEKLDIVEDLRYDFIGNECVVRGPGNALSNGNTNIVIPSEIYGYTVTQIHMYAFDECERLTSIIIPSSITSIGQYAFSDCFSLTSVVFEDDSKLSKIDNNAFSNCISLENITIPEGVISIGYYAFGGCSLINSLSLPKTTLVIGSNVFANCRNLTDVTINGGAITFSIFGSNSYVTDLTIGNSVSFIEDGCLYGLDKLERLSIPFIPNKFGKLFGSTNVYEKVDFAFGESMMIEMMNIGGGIRSVCLGNASDIWYGSEKTYVTNNGTKVFYQEEPINVVSWRTEYQVYGYFYDVPDYAYIPCYHIPESLESVNITNQTKDDIGDSFENLSVNVLFNGDIE